MTEPLHAQKKNFLEFPATNFCTTILSLGPPRSGKTFLALKCIEYWIKIGMFDKYILILPQFKNEFSDSYGWLKEYEQVTVYESFHSLYVNKMILEQEKNRKLHKEGKLTDMPRVFLFIDDATSQGSTMFKDKTLVRIVTENRHLFIHSWICLHYDKGIIAPAVRLNMNFVILYPVKTLLLQKMHAEYVDSEVFTELDNFEKEFLPYWKNAVGSKKFGCLLLARKNSYNSNCCNWFK